MSDRSPDERREGPTFDYEVADLVDTLYGQWRRTTVSMLLGAGILTTVMWGAASPAVFACWIEGGWGSFWG